MAAIVVIEMALHFAVNFKQQVQLSIEFIAFIATRITYMMLALVAHEMKQKEFTLKKKMQNFVRRNFCDPVFIAFVCFFLSCCFFSRIFNFMCSQNGPKKGKRSKLHIYQLACQASSCVPFGRVQAHTNDGIGDGGGGTSIIMML